MTLESPFSILFSDRVTTHKSVSFHGQPVPAHVKPHPKPIQLSVGTPNHGFFPINSFDLGVSLEPFSETQQTISIPKVSENSAEELDIKVGFQYGPTEGQPQLVKFVKDFISEINPPKYSDWNVTFTNGTGDSLNKIFAVLINPGDSVLIESYTYLPVCNNITNYGGTPVSVKINYEDSSDYGIDIDYLKDLLENWESKHPHLKKPKALYTIPTGQNPTGISIPESKRAQIVELAKEHNFVIVEDDPYGYIQLNSRFLEEDVTPEQFIKEILPNSYLQYDNSGHVVRLESFSKTFAPGSRLGFMVGHKDLIKKIIGYATITSRAASGISQLIVNQFILKIGGIQGWIKWNIKVSKEYTRRMQVLSAALTSSEAGKKGYLRVIEPDAGMFAIVDFNFPEQESGDYRSLVDEIRYKLLESGVIVTYGKNFAYDESFSKTAKFIRVTVAAAHDDEEIKLGAERLAQGVVNYFEDK